MKSLVFSHVSTWPSHHAESIEIALSQKNMGDDVLFLSCTGTLATCPANKTKNKYLCSVCRMQTRYSIDNILPKNIITKNLDIKDVRYDEICFKSIEQLKKYKLFDVPFGMMVYSTLTTELNDSFFDIGENAHRINDLIKNSIGLYQEGLKIIKEDNIDHVYIWNGRRSCDGPLVYAASNLGIQFTTFISGGRYNSILARENTYTVHDVSSAKKELSEITHKIENNINRFSIVRDAVSYFDFASGGRGSNKLNYLGYYQFSQSFDKSIDLEGSEKSDKKIIAVFTGTYSEFAGVPGYDDSESFCKNFYEGVTFLQENIHRIPDAELRIRWHPNSRNLNGNERAKLDSIIEQGKKIEGVFHISPDSNFNTYDLIEACDIAVGFGTSVSVESCLYGKPAVFIGHNMFEDLDCFYKPESYENLIELLNSPIKCKNFNHALAWGYYFSDFGNIDFKYLKQHKNRLFYLNSTRVVAPILLFRRYLGNLRRLYSRLLK